MSELVESPAQEQGPVGGAGRLLREARQSAGLHVAALAVSLKVPVRKLEALEQDRYEEVGDPVFVRALAASVCRALKAEPQPVLERLPQGARPRLVADSEGINTPFRAPGDGAAPRWADSIGRPVVVVVGVLLLGALLLLFLPMLQRLGQRVGLPAAATADGTAPAALTTTPAVAPPSTVAPASGAVATPSALSPDAGASAAAAPASAPPAPGAGAAPTQAVPAAAVAEPASAAASAPGMAAAPVSPGRAVAASAVVAAPAAASAAAAVDGILSFHTTGPSWVQVSDARGTVVLHRVVQAGETVAASGTPPFKVTVGKADLTQVEVRGRPFDLQPVTRENVARFEVK